MIKIQKCKECQKELISFQKHYLHPNTKCSGIEDGIRIDMEIVDEGLNQKWIKEVGKPEKDDYDVRIQQEQELVGLKKGMSVRQDRINQLIANLKTIEVNKDGWKEQATKAEQELEELRLKKLKVEAKIEGHWLLRKLWKVLK